MDFNEWIESVSNDEWFWIAKRLSANDTLANLSHQAGPYIPTRTMMELFPSFSSSILNPDKELTARIASHDIERAVRAIWYNNKVSASGTRNETRITRWGGSSSPLLDPDSTGALCVFAFHQTGSQDADHVEVWLARDPMEEELIESLLGEVEPGQFLLGRALHGISRTQIPSNCFLADHEIPEKWKTEFPSGEDIVRLVFDRLAAFQGTPDERLMRRRACEFEVFQSVERAHVLPLISSGFCSVDVFLGVAASIMNRRKSRSGRSLELHLRKIFDESGIEYLHGVTTEGKKRPDFLFPAVDYHSAPAEKLRMLAVKTTLKDRWRQILNEADRVPVKHLFTLQEGMSLNQFDELTRAGVRLVVPLPIQKSYRKEIRPKLMSLSGFMEEISTLTTGI